MTGERDTTIGDLLARGELSATAWFEVVGDHASRGERALLDRIEDRLTLHYPEVVLLLAAAIGVLLAAGLTVGLL